MKVNSRKGRGSGKGAAIDSTSSPLPTPSAPTLPLDQVKQDHDRLVSQWKSSASYNRLKELLSTHSGITSSHVTKAICFGLGSFDPPDGAWDQKRKTHLQLAALLTIVDDLEGRSGHQIQCIFQEPIFNPVDKAFIASLGHEVVESPLGFQLVDPDTLAFAVHLYRDIHSQVIATHVPAMFVGTPYGIWEDFNQVADLDWEQMKKLDQLCDKAEFPGDRGDHTFSSTVIHWRRNDQP